MSPILRCAGLLALGLTLVPPAMAAPPRGYLCTNMMGGNPFRLTIADDLGYSAASLVESYQQLAGEGQFELAEIGSYYHVLSGPLLTDLKVDTVHIMSGNRLTPSGDTGLYDCKKAK